jgi:hypothetical protein
MLVDLPFNSFCNTEKSVVPSAAGTTISPSMIAEARADVPSLVGDLLETFRPIVAAPGEDLNPFVHEMDLNQIHRKLISCIQRLPEGTLAIEVARAGSMKPV